MFVDAIVISYHILSDCHSVITSKNYLSMWCICRCSQGPPMFKSEWHAFRLGTGCLTVWCDRYGHTCLESCGPLSSFYLHLKTFGFVRFNGFDLTVSSRTHWAFFKHKLWLLKSVNNDLGAESLKCEINNLKKFWLKFVIVAIKWGIAYFHSDTI